jgi:hypothetical protein
MKIITNLQILAILMGIIISTIYYFNKSSKASIEVKNITISPINPAKNDTITVSVELKDINNIKVVRLFHKINQDSTKILEMIKPNENNIFSWQIPPQQQFNEISFYIEAESIDGDKSYFPYTTPIANSNYLKTSSSNNLNKF